ncbi:hypothetical protein DPMN_096919 [Dreissena polymorpha]|uniref:Uncharacterized protein n=1 Tax=Dreissena polymorpha TaxID=45954 RepID=A0A9D4L9L8_DREPO|nr:hypothetical protein DPMN_096919 [Dreissena polymorpha]
MVSKLDYEKKPDYSEMRKIFTQGLADLHIKDTWKLALPIAGAKPSTPMVSPKVGFGGLCFNSHLRSVSV